MRLFKINKDGSFSPESFSVEKAPPFASPTPGARSLIMRSNFRTLKTALTLKKPAVRKLLFCSIHDGLQYFWVDTCSIDQKSHVELSEAIDPTATTTN